MIFTSTDVAVPDLNRKFAYSRTLLMPSDHVKEDFVAEVAALRLQIDKLGKYNQKPPEARDLLLPRLMNGVIEV